MSDWMTNIDFLYCFAGESYSQIISRTRLNFFLIFRKIAGGAAAIDEV